MSRPLNVVVVCFDTLRYDAVATDLCRTPHLEAFAAQAVCYRNAWGEGLPTIPFRRAVHTGRRSFPWNCHLDDRGSFPNLLGWHAIPASHMTLAERLYQQGYATGLISDVWHLFKATMNFTRGFVSWDFIRGQEGDTYELSRASFLDPSPYAGRRVGPPSYLYQTRHRVSPDDYFVAKVLDRAADWVEANRGNEPYFLWVDSFSPHEFWDPPPSYADAYYPGEGLRDYIVPQLLNRGPNEPPPSAADIERTRALYRGYVTFCDERFGRFMDRLQKVGAHRDTVVVVLSDHGTELREHGRFGKSAAHLYAHNTQINLLIRHPDVSASLDVYDFVLNVDLVPTLLDLLGMPAGPLDGVSVWPWSSRPRTPRDHVVIGWDVYASVRDRTWNWMVNTVQPHDQRLYHLPTDPGEERNVIDEHPAVAAQMRAHLEELLGGPLPARYVHRPAGGFAATPGGLRTIREHRARSGERWEGSNQV